MEQVKEGEKFRQHELFKSHEVRYIMDRLDTHTYMGFDDYAVWSKKRCVKTVVAKNETTKFLSSDAVLFDSYVDEITQNPIYKYEFVQHAS